MALNRTDRNGDSVAMLENAQLFKALGLFERRDRPRDKLTEERRAVDVEPDVAKGRRAGCSAAGAISVAAFCLLAPAAPWEATGAV